MDHQHSTGLKADVTTASTAPSSRMGTPTHVCMEARHCLMDDVYEDNSVYRWCLEDGSMIDKLDSMDG